MQRQLEANAVEGSYPEDLPKSVSKAAGETRRALPVSAEIALMSPERPVFSPGQPRPVPAAEH